MTLRGADASSIVLARGVARRLHASALLLPLVLHPRLPARRRASASLNLDFFTQLPKPVGETGGGMANAIVGTLIAGRRSRALLGLPSACCAGVYLAEYGHTPARLDACASAPTC